MESNHVRDLMEAYSSIYAENEEVEQLDEEMTTSHSFRTGKPRIPSAPTLPAPTLPAPTSGKPQQKKIKPVGEEVENWVNSLIDEGYDLSEYTWDDMCEMYMNLDEAKSKLPGDDLFSQFYRGKNARKRKGVKTHQPGQNRYLAQQNQKRSAARYAADMGRDRTPSASDYDNHGGGSRNEQADLFDIIKGHLLDEGFADTEEAALAIMTNMSEDWKQSIVEGGFNSSGRYDVGGGRTVGPVAGAVRSLFSGNLPKGQTYVPPSPQRGTNRPPAVPSSKDDSGKLTDFGAGGGKAKLKTGMSVGQVERQGRMNRGDYSG